MKKGYILVDIKKCLACKSCQIQCAVTHSKSKDLREAIYETPLPKPRMQIEKVAEVVIPLQCRHCEDAPCIEICPTKAIDRENKESPVVINQGRCVGCKSCLLVCPFGVIRLDKKGKAMIKCDLCFARLEADENPACVSACPTGALQFKVEKAKEYLVEFKGKKTL